MQISETELNAKLDTKDLKVVSRVIRAVNHPLRIAIIKLIANNDRITVTQIYFKLRVEQSVASQHLAILRNSQVLVAHRNGKNIHYSLNHDKLKTIFDCIDLLK